MSVMREKGTCVCFKTETTELVPHITHISLRVADKLISRFPIEIRIIFG